MKKIQVLGPGCPNCKITEITQITQFGVMATPGLVVDGEVLISGRVPSEAEVKKLLE
jgi:hypothetical protein